MDIRKVYRHRMHQRINFKVSDLHNWPLSTPRTPFMFQKGSYLDNGYEFREKSFTDVFVSSRQVRFMSRTRILEHFQNLDFVKFSKSTLPVDLEKARYLGHPSRYSQTDLIWVRFSSRRSRIIYNMWGSKLGHFWKSAKGYPLLLFQILGTHKNANISRTEGDIHTPTWPVGFSRRDDSKTCLIYQFWNFHFFDHYLTYLFSSQTGKFIIISHRYLASGSEYQRNRPHRRVSRGDLPGSASIKGFLDTFGTILLDLP